MHTAAAISVIEISNWFKLIHCQSHGCNIIIIIVIVHDCAGVSQLIRFIEDDVRGGSLRSPCMAEMRTLLDMNASF